MNKIGDHIKALRKQTGISARELSEKVEISHNTIALYERNIVVPTLPSAVKLAEYFKVPLEALVYGKTVIDLDFKDNELLSLSKEIDALEDNETITIAKKYLKKLIDNFNERKGLVDQAR